MTVNEPTPVTPAITGLESPRTACNAPFVTLHLDPRGIARVCCENKLHRVGDITAETLDEIWHGERLRALRGALQSDDFSLGCEGCRAGVLLGERHTVRAGLYDLTTGFGSDPPTPTRLELELSSRCNLQCIMCNGELSSAIRSIREGRAPLPKVYGDRFFDELGRLAPRLEHVSLLGGEPFLGRETLRACDVLADNGFTGTSHVTTNGTVIGSRVGELIRRLRMDVAVSIDGRTVGLVEQIRTGIDFAAVSRNLEWFRQAVEDAGTRLMLHYCLMPQNWFQSYDVMLWADELDIDVVVLSVRHPVAMSFDHAGSAERLKVATQLRHRARTSPALHRNRNAFDQAIARLEISTETSVAVGPRIAETSTSVAEAIRALTSWADARGVHEMEFDSGERLVSARPNLGSVLGVDLTDYVGAHMRELIDPMLHQLGAIVRSAELPAPPGCEHRALGISTTQGPITVRSLEITAGESTTSRILVAARPGLFDDIDLFG